MGPFGGDLRIATPSTMGFPRGNRRRRGVISSNRASTYHRKHKCLNAPEGSVEIHSLHSEINQDRPTPTSSEQRHEFNTINNQSSSTPTNQPPPLIDRTRTSSYRIRLHVKVCRSLSMLRSERGNKWEVVPPTKYVDSTGKRWHHCRRE